MRFSSIHAADLHIDSPSAGLGVKDPVVAERFAKAGRRAEAVIATLVLDPCARLFRLRVFDRDV